MSTTPSLRPAALALAAVTVLAAAGYGLYALGLRQGQSALPQAGAASAPAPAALKPLPQGISQGEDATRRHLSAGLKAGDVDPDNGHKILYYHDPMVPGNQFDQPAKSPFMDMMLVPVYADTGPGAAAQDTPAGISVSARTQQNLGLRTAEAVTAALTPQLSVEGNIGYNERDQVLVQARSGGFVEKLYVRAALDPVTTGQPMVDLYLPEWVAAQEELLSLKRLRGDDLAPLVDAARQRMRQLGMAAAQIAAVERSGQVQTRVTIAAPQGGVVVELMVREGMTVMAGASLFRLNGLRTVWATAEVPENQAGWLRPGAAVTVRTAALPDQVFSGRVQALLPVVNTATRTRQARLELANPGARLVPGMFVQMQLADPQATQGVVVPTEAIIQTGTRTVVMLAEAEGRFRPVTVRTGLEVNGQTQITEGLQAGQRVVVSGQFLIDSEASLKGIEGRLNAAADAAPAASGATP
jgi:membrane fusion protein, copper/silver efflux system